MPLPLQGPQIPYRGSIPPAASEGSVHWHAPSTRLMQGRGGVRRTVPFLQGRELMNITRYALAAALGLGLLAGPVSTARAAISRAG